MTDRKIELAEAFIRAQPGDAARLVEQLDAEAAAGLVHRLHADAAAQLLQAMLPQYVARIIGALDANRASELLQRMDTSRVVVFLRHLRREARRRIVDNLPARTQATSSLLLNYAAESVGAWMDAHAFTLPEDCMVEEALKRISADPVHTQTSRIYVLNRELRVRGTVDISRLLGADAGNPVLSLLEPAPPGVLGRSTLLSVRDAIAWDSTDVVAVLNRNHQFVGALTHARMRQGLRELAAGLTEPSRGDPVSGIAEVYAGTLFALLESVGHASGLTGNSHSAGDRS